MIHDVNCKICKVPIAVEVDDAYEELGDPFKLLKLATCNRCYDLRTEREAIFTNIGSCCQLLIVNPTNKDLRIKSRKLLVILTRKYAELVSKFHRSNHMLWSEEFADMILDKPDKWFKCLDLYREQARQSRKEAERQAA